MLLFLHLPKTAGTTLRLLLYDVYGKDALFETYLYHNNQSVADAFTSLSPDAKSQVALVAGHFGYGLHTYIDVDCRYLTMLREPVERVVSTYFFMLGGDGLERQPQMEGQNLTLCEFLEAGITPQVDNGLTRLLSGIGASVEYGKCTAEHLETAKKNLTDHFDWVGLLEEFDESVVLLGTKLGWERVPLYRKENVTPKRPRMDELSGREHETILKYCNFDVELYRFARDRFRADVAAQAPEFERKLRHYRGHIRDAQRILQEEKMSWAKR